MLLVRQDGLEAGLGQVAEQGGARHAAAGDERAHLLDLRLGERR